jgi:integrase
MNMKLENSTIENDPIFHEFTMNKNVRESTLGQYAYRVGLYCKHVGLTPTQLIEEATEEEEDALRMPKRKIKKHMISFCQYLKDRNMSYNQVKNVFGTIRSFYKEFEIQLPNVKCIIKQEQELLTVNDIPSKKDIKKALKRCNHEYKAIILLMASSGMGRSEILNLTINDYIESLRMDKPLDLDNPLPQLREQEHKICRWSIRRKKTGAPYVTFSSPESIVAINNHIEYEIENKNPYKSLNQHLFNIDGDKINEASFNTYFRRLNDACNFGMYGTQRFFKSHNLRKYFATTIENSGHMEGTQSEFLLGHKIPNKLIETYKMRDFALMETNYLKVLPELSINPVETTVVESEEYKELKRQIEELREQLNEERFNSGVLEQQVEKHQLELEKMHPKKDTKWKKAK